jgi:pilus assembly protein CpaE
MYPDDVPLITPTSSGVHVPSSAILLLEQDEVVGAVIRSALTGVGYGIETVTDAAEAIKRASEYGLLIIDQIDASRNAADVCREVRGTPDLSAIPVLCICQGDDVEERIRFLEAGADDVLAKPFDARELEARVEALLLRFQRSKELSPAMTSDPGGQLRRMVAVFSPKGGVGTTTVAVNIAAAHAAKRPDRVLLIDLALQFGQVATHLNLAPRQTLADLAHDEQSQREPELLRTYATKHASGLHVLAAPGSPDLAELVLPHHVERLLETALMTYDAIVIDAGSVLNAHSLTALERAEAVLLPVHPEVAALKAVHSLLEYLDHTGSIRTKTTFVLNNAFDRVILKMRDLESALGAKVTAELPYDGFLFLKAVNEGNPIVLGAPRSPAAASLVALAAAAFGDTVVGSHEPSQEHRASRFGGLRRRK